MLVINLDELYFGELFEISGQWTCDGVECPVRLALTGEIDVGDTIGVLELAVPCEPVEHQGETLIAFHITGTLEVFVENGTDQVL